MLELTAEKWKSESSEYEDWRETGKSRALRFYWRYVYLYWTYLFQRSIPFCRSAQHRLCLDVGCGDGNALSWSVKTKHYYGIGLDPSRSSLRVLLRRAKLEGLPIDVVNGIGEYLPLRPRWVHLAMVASVLDHSMDPVLVMREVQRVLADKGMLLVYQSLSCTRKRRTIVGHLREFNAKEFFSLLDRFRIKRGLLVYGIALPFRFLQVVSALESIVTRMIPYYPTAIVVAEKSQLDET